MTSPKAVLKSVGPKLVPFFKTLAIYFVLFIPDDVTGSWFSCLIKCLPIMSLVIFVLLHGMNLREEYKYSRRILSGLLFSCLGDALLIDMPNYFIPGIVCFGIAHLCYAWAFGFRPLNPYAGVVCFASAMAVFSMLLSGLHGIMVPACFLYMVVITVMTWRAIARVQLFEDLWTWTKLCSCAGAFLFFISDLTLATRTFMMPVPYGQAIIMGTYYLAQLGIALSVVDSMNTCQKELKSVGPKLVPFFKTVAIYFVLFIPDGNPSWFACLIKCLPVVSLCVFVLLHGMSLRDEYCYSRRILTGLIFSCLGDALLIYSKQYFLHGMASFGVAHAVYALAFGFHPPNPYAGAVCMSIAVGMYYVLLQGLHGLMAPAVFVYLMLIGLMTWRAIARVQLFEDLWTWTKLCSCFGGIMFCVSDTIIGINRFLMPIPYSQVLVMVTYYAAQLGIALSVVDSMATTTPPATRGPAEQATPSFANHQRLPKPLKIKVN